MQVEAIVPIVHGFKIIFSAVAATLILSILAKEVPYPEILFLNLEIMF